MNRSSLTAQENVMEGAKLIVIWIACVVFGAVVGFAAGYVLWQLGFEMIGSAVALVGAGVGGIVTFFAFLGWRETHVRSRG
jgi:Na+/citrate or Na+/malate symporter